MIVYRGAYYVNLQYVTICKPNVNRDMNNTLSVYLHLQIHNYKDMPHLMHTFDI